MDYIILYTKEFIIWSNVVHTMKRWIQDIHVKAGSVSSLQLNISAGPDPANSTVAVFPLTVTPPLIRWVVQKEGSELISNLLLSIARSSLLLVAATRSTYLPGSRSVNDTLPEEPEWGEGGGLNNLYPHGVSTIRSTLLAAFNFRLSPAIYMSHQIYHQGPHGFKLTDMLVLQLKMHH